jgi:hypothetical protein
MSLPNAMLAASAAGFAAIVLYLALRSGRPRNVVLTALTLAVGLWLVYAIAPASVRTRGDGDGATLAVSYVAMLLGMVAHYVYAQAERGEKRLTIDWMPFLMPILASPIVFIPLVSLAGEVTSSGGILTRARVMVYLVAFQNGFFWKHFFDQRKQEAAPA